MRQGIFIQPASCQADGMYYLRINQNGFGWAYQRVKFLAYRPHPAEVLVHDGHKARVVHRRFLYCKEPENDSSS